MDSQYGFESDMIWRMTNLHIQSILPPFEENEIYPRATRFFRRADAMGLLDEPVHELSTKVLRRIARRLAERGLVRDLAARFTASGPSREELIQYLDTATRALDESPVPAAELTRLNSVLGHELLAALLDISAASLQRYQKGERDVPDDVADRAHFLTSVIAALEGTYNDFGVRRWFERPRSVFNGRSARQLLSRRWSPTDESAQRVLAAAESLQQLGAT